MISESVGNRPVGFRMPASPRIVSGLNAMAELPRLLADLGSSRVVLVTSRSMGASALFAEVQDLLRSAGVEVGAHTGIRPHAPMSDVRALQDLYRAREADAVISLGGASVIDAAKALVSLEKERGCVHVTIPALFGGAEVTPRAGVTEGGKKLRLTGEGLIPRAIVLDPAVPGALPRQLTSVSLFNALSHCCEGLFAADSNPFSEACYLRAATLTARAADGFRTGAVSTVLAHAQEASVLAGSPRVRMGLAHALVHAISPILGVSHALSHAVVMRAVAHHTMPTQDERRRSDLVAALSLGAGWSLRDSSPESVVVCLTELMQGADVPLGLGQVGVTWTQVAAAVRQLHDEVWSEADSNLGTASFESLLKTVWSGELTP